MKDIMESKAFGKARETWLQAQRTSVSWLPALFTAMLAMLMLTPMRAQTTTGTISGTVVDPSGQAVQIQRHGLGRTS
jgi:hypothetical protein